MNSKLLSIACLFVTTLTAASFSQDEISPQHLKFFERKIRPVLATHCYSCHSKDSKSVKGGLILDTREGIRAGGDSGHAVVPGDLDSSIIMEALRYESYEMPPKAQLPASVIADFEKWIEMGAPDPRDGPTLIKREIDFEEAKNHWAFQPIQNPPLPEVNQKRWPRTSVDHFILAKLESSKLEAVNDADRATLVRRLYFDLIGLPPTPEQLSDALADDSPEAIEQLVDQLLESKHFGERWGRHWLDVVRYAESNGRERNFVFPHAWRYRDYVIDAFNKDKPFDRFVHEQVAGDLLDQSGSEQRVATGFLAIGPKLLNERNQKEFTMDLVDEQVDVTTRAFMSLTVSCARCHDHKFDPIPTAEYYSMAGIFRSTQTLYGTRKQQGNRNGSTLLTLSDLSSEETKRLVQAAAKEKKQLAAQLASLKKELKVLQDETKEIRNKQKKNKAFKPDPVRAKKLKNSIAALRKQVQPLQKQINSFDDSAGLPQAMGVTEGKVQDSPIYVRGETSSPKGNAPRGFLTILDPNLEQPVLDNKQSGRRELAYWLTDSQNTLTARVLVNRVWSHLFGAGLVATVDNFGATGEAPSHPELLDHLATRFVEEGWSMKTLIRELVLSRTYQLSGTHNKHAYGVDPENRFLWRHSPQRVDAESLRDAILLASGELDATPAVGSPVSKLKGEYGRQAKVADLLAGNRHRTVYLPIIRNAVPESLKLFDFAEPSILVGERDVTTVPTQALFFLNSKFVIGQCDSLAESLINESDLMEDRVNLAYQKILSRYATSAEVRRAGQFLKKAREEMKANAKETTEINKKAWSGFVQALFGSAEFRYVE